MSVATVKRKTLGNLTLTSVNVYWDPKGKYIYIYFDNCPNVPVNIFVAKSQAQFSFRLGFFSVLFFLSGSYFFWLPPFPCLDYIHI